MGTRDEDESDISAKRRLARSKRKRNNIPWSRQPGEPVEGFEFFTVYRDLPRRTILEAARVAGESAQRFHGYAKNWNWLERASAWDNEVDRRIQNAEVSKLEEMKRRQLQLGVGMQAVGQMELQALIKLIQTKERRCIASGTERPPHLNPKDLVRFVEAGAKLERVNMKEPDTIVQVKTDDRGLDFLSKEELKAYYDLLSKMKSA